MSTIAPRMPPILAVPLDFPLGLCYHSIEVRRMRIFCFGDSNTYGYDPRGYLGGRYGAEDRWPDILAAVSGWEVVNGGANGRQIPRSPYALRLLAEREPVDVFLVMLGTNDLLQGASAREAAGRMEGFLRQLLPRCGRVLLVSPPPMVRGAWVPSDGLVSASLELADAYRAVAEELGVSFLNTRGWGVEIAFDGVHFTEAGHRTFAARLYDFLRVW